MAQTVSEILSQQLDVVAAIAAYNESDPYIAAIQELPAHLADNMLSVSSYIEGDGVADDTEGLLEAKEECISSNRGFHVPQNKIVRITSEVDLTGINNIKIEGIIVVDCASGVGLIIGGDSTNTTPLKAYVNKISEGASMGAGVVGLRTQGIKNGVITVMSCFRWKLYADGAETDISSGAYATYTLGKIDDFQIISQGGGWINQNQFITGRVEKFTMDGDYPHNNNIFQALDLESVDMDINSGVSNVFWNARLEGTNTIDFAEGTHSNVIIQSYASIARAALGAPTATITNNGVNNKVIRLHNLLRDIMPVVSLTKDTKIFNTTAENGAVSVTAGLDKITVANSTDLWSSDFIPVIKGSAFFMESDQSNWRPKIYCYNSSKVALIGADPGYMNIQGSIWVDADGYYGFSSNRQNVIPGMVEHSDVAYIKIVLRSGSSCVPFKYVNISMFAEKDGDIPLRLAIVPKTYPLVLASSPTQGFAKQGQLVAKTTGGIWTCTKSIEQTLSATAAASATSVSVTSATGIANGDIVGILLDDGSTNWRVVAGLSGTTFNVTALTGQASAGNRIVFNLWT